MEVIFCDMNERLCSIMETVNPTIKVVCDDIRTQTDCDAWVSPANSVGMMDGGIDLVYRDYFGSDIQDVVHAKIEEKFTCGYIPLDFAMSVETNKEPGHIILAPTMPIPMIITDYSWVFLATSAAIREAKQQGFKKIVIPGMGTCTGRVPYEIATALIGAAIKLELKNK